MVVSFVLLFEDCCLLFQLCANASLSLEASYFNDKVAEWEPLIEPISDENAMRPIGLEVTVRQLSSNCPSIEKSTTFISW